MMVNGLKEIGYVSAFGIVLNYQEPRLSEQLQDTLKLFSQMFGTEFFKNALLIFTKFSYDKASIHKRKRGLLMSDD